MLFLLAVGRLPHAVRTSGNNPSQVLTVLIRDSVVYFGGEMSAVIANAIMSGAARVSPSDGKP